jgi:hypothetical protein
MGFKTLYRVVLPHKIKPSPSLKGIYLCFSESAQL